MKIKAKIKNSGMAVGYLLDTHDGQRASSQMPATVAAEIVERAGSVGIRDEEGYEISINGEMYFPKDLFDFDEGELEGLRHEGAPKKRSRPTHAELVDKADKTMTNPQLYKAIEQAEAERAEKKHGTSKDNAEG